MLSLLLLPALLSLFGDNVHRDFYHVNTAETGTAKESPEYVEEWEDLSPPTTMIPTPHDEAQVTGLSLNRSTIYLVIIVFLIVLNFLTCVLCMQKMLPGRRSPMEEDPPVRQRVEMRQLLPTIEASMRIF